VSHETKENAMIDISFGCPASGRAILIAAAVTAALAGSAGGIARAQTLRATTPNTLRTDTVPAAPVGHYQPRRVRLPTNERAEENAELSSERGFDQQLQICRGC
jgi:hypothetical protein